MSSTENDQAKSMVSSSISAKRMFIVANQLPLKVERTADNESWTFNWNKESLLLHVNDGFPKDMEVFYVGTLDINFDRSERGDVSQILMEKFQCVPTFLVPHVLTNFLGGYCGQQLWPLFHSMFGGLNDETSWKHYEIANFNFFEKLVKLLRQDDYVWIHDYHLMLLPLLLRGRFKQVKIGFFLHSPFPPSEIYRTLTKGEKILGALLNADLIGFHTLDYAWHFLSCCRILGLEFHSNRGYMGVEHCGRNVGIKVMPIGIHVGQIKSAIKVAEGECRLEELRRQFEGKTVFIGVDDMDIFKGINLKLLAMEEMLKTHSHLIGKVVLVQIVNPARGGGMDLENTQAKIKNSCRRINEKFGQPGYEPVVFIDRPVSISERAAYYSIAECVVVTAVRDGMNLIPYEYTVCREGLSALESSSLNSSKVLPKKSMIVVSKFVGCSQYLSGAIRVNPFDFKETGQAMCDTIEMSNKEKELRHEKHYRYISTHNVGYWSGSFLQDWRNVAQITLDSMFWQLII